MSGYSNYLNRAGNIVCLGISRGSLAPGESAGSQRKKASSKVVKERDAQSKHHRFSNIFWSHFDILPETGVALQFSDYLKIV